MQVAPIRQGSIPLAYYAGRLAARFLRNYISNQAQRAATTAYESAVNGVSRYLRPSNTVGSAIRSTQQVSSMRSSARSVRRRVSTRRAVRTLARTVRRARRSRILRRRRVRRAVRRLARPVRVLRRKIVDYQEQDVLLKVRYDQPVEFGSGDIISSLHLWKFSTYLNQSEKDAIFGGSATQVKLKSYGISVRAPQAVVRTKQSTYGLTTNYAEFREVPTKITMVGFRDYRGDQRDHAKDFDPVLYSPIANIFSVQQMLDHPASRKFSTKPLVMRRKVKQGRWVTWNNDVSSVDPSKTTKAVLQDDSSDFLSWIVALMPQRTINVPQGGATPKLNVPTQKLCVPPFGNNPMWFHCGVLKPWVVDQGADQGSPSYAYHVRMNVDFWIRLGVRRKMVPDVLTLTKPIPKAAYAQPNMM